jgi:hypothetical protein
MLISSSSFAAVGVSGPVSRCHFWSNVLSPGIVLTVRGHLIEDALNLVARLKSQSITVHRYKQRVVKQTLMF